MTKFHQLFATLVILILAAACGKKQETRDIMTFTAPDGTVSTLTQDQFRLMVEEVLTLGEQLRPREGRTPLPPDFVTYVESQVAHQWLSQRVEETVAKGATATDESRLARAISLLDGVALIDVDGNDGEALEKYLQALNAAVQAESADEAVTIYTREIADYINRLPPMLVADSDAVARSTWEHREAYKLMNQSIEGVRAQNRQIATQMLSSMDAGIEELRSKGSFERGRILELARRSSNYEVLEAQHGDAPDFEDLLVALVIERELDTVYARILAEGARGLSPVGRSVVDEATRSAGLKRTTYQLGEIIYEPTLGVYLLPRFHALLPLAGL